MRSRQPEGTETGARFDVQQPKQIRLYREACARAGRTREPGVSASRSIFVLINEQDRMYFGGWGVPLRGQAAGCLAFILFASALATRIPARPAG